MHFKKGSESHPRMPPTAPSLAVRRDTQRSSANGNEGVGSLLNARRHTTGHSVHSLGVQHDGSWLEGRNTSISIARSFPGENRAAVDVAFTAEKQGFSLPKENPASVMDKKSERQP